MKPLLRMLPVVGFLFFGLATHLSAQSESAPGGSLGKPGIAMVKPQPWSKDGEATAMEFLSVSNHTGYYQFRTAKSPASQVKATKVVAVIVFPDVPASILSNDARAAMQKTIDEFSASSKKFPSAARALEEAVSPLKAEAAKYDAGSIKENGQWIPQSAYYQSKAASLADLLKTEILSAQKIKDVDLATNQYFVGLQELAASAPSVAPILTGIRALYDSLVRKEDRKDILSQLSSPSITFDQAEALVKKLRALLPQEDANANIFVQGWDAANASAGKLTDQILGVQRQFEACLALVSEAPGVPVLPPDLTASLEQMSDAVKKYRAGSPPAVIQVPLPIADAMSAFGDNLPTLEKHMKARALFDAKSILDSLGGKARLIGQKTWASLVGVQKQVNSDLEKFESLRKEAILLADNSKTRDALKKYEEAYAIMPAKDIAAAIESLKKP